MTDQRRVPGRAAAAAAGVLLALAPALATGNIASASAGPCTSEPGWREVAAVATSGWPETYLHSITVIERNDAWALGSSQAGTHSSGPATLWHWNGTKWAQVTPPAPYASLLSNSAWGAVRSAGNSIWLIGSSRWLRYDGHSWTSGSEQMPGTGAAEVSDAAAFGPSDLWAFGYDSHGSFAERFNGTRWNRMALPSPGADSIVSASAVSGSDIWAGVSRSGGPAGQGDLVHWNGRSWSPVRLPAPFIPQWYQPGAVFAESDSDVWVVGAVPSGTSGTASAAAHWNGHAWTVVRLASGNASGPVAITGDGHGGVWIVPGAASQDVRSWHFAGGRLEKVEFPGQLGLYPVQAASVPGTSSVWVVGSVWAPNPYSTDGIVYLYGSVPR